MVWILLNISRKYNFLKIRIAWNDSYCLINFFESIVLLPDFLCSWIDSWQHESIHESICNFSKLLGSLHFQTLCDIMSSNWFKNQFLTYESILESIQGLSFQITSCICSSSIRFMNWFKLIIFSLNRFMNQFHQELLEEQFMTKSILYPFHIISLKPNWFNF